MKRIAISNICSCKRKNVLYTTLKEASICWQLDCMSKRMIANSKMTVFPEPVGALTTSGLSEYNTCINNSIFHLSKNLTHILELQLMNAICAPESKSYIDFHYPTAITVRVLKLMCSILV